MPADLDAPHRRSRAAPLNVHSSRKWICRRSASRRPMLVNEKPL
jgi:hypothetical protein